MVLQWWLETCKRGIHDRFSRRKEGNLSGHYSNRSSRRPEKRGIHCIDRSSSRCCTPWLQNKVKAKVMQNFGCDHFLGSLHATLERGWLRSTSFGVL